MKSDALTFLAYEYGEAIGRPASEVINLPVDELLGFVAYRKHKKALLSNGN